MAVASVIVAVSSAAATIAVIVEGPRGGDWAGALWTFVPLLVFAAAGAAECLRGAMRAARITWALAAVLALQAAFYIARIVLFLAVGPDDPLFEQWVGTVSASVLTVTLTVVAVIVLSVLRSARAPMRGYQASLDDGVVGTGILSCAAFLTALAGLCERAQWRSELVGVISVRIEDLEQISTAFGSEVAGAVTDAWRSSVRRHAPSHALVAEDGANGLLVGARFDSAEAARREAGGIYRGLFDDLGRVGGGVIPVIGIGVALSDAAGYDPEELSRIARDAAGRATATVEASVLIGEVE